MDRTGIVLALLAMVFWGLTFNDGFQLVSLVVAFGVSVAAARRLAA